MISGLAINLHDTKNNMNLTLSGTTNATPETIGDTAGTKREKTHCIALAETNGEAEERGMREE